MNKNKFSKKTSWSKAANWYDKLMGETGSYFHQSLVIPGALRLLDLKKGDSLLDLGCGQGILGKKIPKGIYYQGIDNSSNLINLAKKSDKNQEHHYLTADVGKELPLSKKEFSHIALILSLQNMEFPQAVIKNASLHSKIGSKLVIILNHPCFRIPRQSGWQTTTDNKNQYRWINRYLTPLKIPITIHPGKKHSPVTWSFHYPLSAYSNFLLNSDYMIDKIEELVSDKKSQGSNAKMENRLRNEIPLFMVILARKKR